MTPPKKKLQILVETKFNSYKIIPHYYNNRFALHLHTFIISAFFSTHLALPFIKRPYSWLFHITKICTLEYIVKNSKNKITIHFIIFWYYKKFTQQYKHIIQCKSLCFSVLLKTWIKITTELHVVYQNKIYGFLLQSSYNYSHSFPKLFILESSLL
jgi:hypothetical protein